MRLTKMITLCALQASSVSAFVTPIGPSPGVRIAKIPVLTTPGLKRASSLAVCPLRNRHIPALSAEAPALSGDGKPAPAPPLSAEDKRMFVRWSYLLCLANSLVNSATLIQFNEVVMHMTGPSSKGPLFLASGLKASGWHNMYTIGAFLVGCFIAGLATAKDDGNTPIASSGSFMVLSGILLLISGGMAKKSLISCLFVAACAGGMLNGLTTKITTYRVSHVTGTLTDMGLLFGKGVASTLEPALALKLRDLTVLMALWLVGGCTAFWMSTAMSVGNVMSVASAIVIAIGLKGMTHK